MEEDDYDLYLLSQPDTDEERWINEEARYELFGDDIENIETEDR